MAKLTYKQRKRLPATAFVFRRERKYPIPDKAHARNALARVAQFGSPTEQAAVRRAVKARFPSIEQGRKRKRGKARFK